MNEPTIFNQIVYKKKEMKNLGATTKSFKSGILF